jgi:Putative lumazine-binding
LSGQLELTPDREREALMIKLATLMVATAVAAPASAQALDAAAVRAIEAVAYDYVDGQLEGDAKRVARSLHPDLAKRAAVPANSEESLALRRMTRDELVSLTRDGALKTPREKWDRSVRVLDIAGNAAVARVETPWFVDYFHLGRWGERWVIVNALWYPKPQASC